jgi:hypothetical protein
MTSQLGQSFHSSTFTRLCLRASFVLLASTLVAVTAAGQHSAAISPSMGAAYGTLPLSFEPNQGQTDTWVKFLSRGRGYTLFLTATEAVLELQRPVSPEITAPGKPDVATSSLVGRRSTVLRMRLEGADAAATIEPLDPLPGRVNYFIGNNAKKWHADIPTYARVRYHQVYPGVDLVYYGNQQQLEYDLEVAPGADPAAIRVALDAVGVQSAPRGLSRTRLALNSQGDLVIAGDGASVRFGRPVAYQRPVGRDGRAETRFVEARWVLRSRNQAGFQVGRYDTGEPLIIDPILVYSTYLAGSLKDGAFAIAVDAAGSAYVTGDTNSADFPTPAGAFDTVCGSDGTCNVAGSHGADNSNTDVFVTKLSANGSSLVYSTYLGGALQEGGRGIAVDANGNAYVTGFTISTDFPTTTGAFQTSCGPVIGKDRFTCAIIQTTTCGFAGVPDAFVTKLNPSGSALVYSTFLGGSLNDVGTGIAVNAAGEAYISGATYSQQSLTASGCGQDNQSFAYPTTAGGFMAAPALSGTPWPANSGVLFAVFSKLTADGSGLVYSTYLGALGPYASNSGQAVAIDSSGNGYMTGVTNSPGFPTTQGVVQGTVAGPAPPSAACGGAWCQDAFVARFNPAQSGAASLVYSTLLGGGGNDYGMAIAADSSGSVYLTGSTQSADFPVTQFGFLTTCPGSCQQVKSFVAKLNPTASALVYSTFLGGTGTDNVNALAVDSSGNAHVVGQTNSFDFPTRYPIQATLPGGGGAHGFVSTLNAAGTGLLFSTYLGGAAGTDSAQGVALDSAANPNIYVTGTTLSNDFPTTAGAFQTTCTKCGTNGYFSAAFVSKIPTDTDGDGLPDWWERQFGLDPYSAVGDNGASGDPDHDGKTNLQEYLAGTDPRGFFTRYFAEGAANDFFDCYFAAANPGSTPANVLFRFLRDDGVTVRQYVNVPPTSRRTVNAKSVPGLAPVGGFSTIVESDVEIAVDRTMTWDATGYGSHAETAVIAPAATWYLAEGATHSGFQLYYLIENPNDTPVDVQITYLRPAPLTPIVLSYPGIAPHSRNTIYVNGENPGLAAADISGIVTSLTPGGPIIVERAMYLNSGGLFFRAGHDSAGVTAPATDWFLAEGATGFFDLFVLVANPNAAEAHLTVTYLLPGGATVSSPLTVAPNSRWTVYVNGQAPNGVSLANTAVSTKVHSDLPVLVERSMWWPSGGPSVWEEAHNSPGVTSAATRWALADGEQGGARNTDTYVLIANTSAFAGTVRVTALLEDGTTLARDVAVPGNSRTTIFMGDFPDPQVSPFGNLLSNKRFGTLIESLSGPAGTAEIVVERAMYSDANGVHWAAGTDLVATRLGLPN